MSRKALMIIADNQTFFPSGASCGIVGGALPSAGSPAAEVDTRIQITETTSFSNLAFNINSGGSGTNTLTLKTDAGGGTLKTLSASIAGTGTAEDLVHTDTIPAGEKISLIYTDTGSDSLINTISMNCEMGEGFGAYHGCANYNSPGNVSDSASATTYMGFSGPIPGDGFTNELSGAFRIRGYTHFTALQANIVSNARLNTSTIRNRKNSTNGTGVLSIGAGATGHFSSTGLSDTFSTGDTTNISLTLGAGVEDLVISYIVGTFKSNTNTQDLWASSASTGRTRPSGATPSRYSLEGGLQSAGTNNQQVKVGFSAKASNLRIYLAANTYSAAATLNLEKNSSTNVLTTTITNGVTGWFENTSDTALVGPTDTLQYNIVGGTSGSITIAMMGCTLKNMSTGNASFLLNMI